MLSLSQSPIKLVVAEGFKRNQTFMKTHQMLWGDKQKHNIHKQGRHVMKSFNDEIDLSTMCKHSW